MFDLDIFCLILSMGIYNNRGLEYRIQLFGHIPIGSLAGTACLPKFDEKTNTLTFLTREQTDDRLILSNYYLKQKDTYLSKFDAEALPLSKSELDIDLTAEERTHLEIILKLLSSVIQDHGWYDVTTVSTTY